MDLEDELRQAMAEHVTGVSAPGTLAGEARRRHQRTVRRRATFAVAAAGVVAAIAVVPTYQAIRPQPVSNQGPEGRHAGAGGAKAVTSAAPSPSTAWTGTSTSPSVGPSTPAHSGTRPSRHPGTHGTLPQVTKALLSYLPAGINPGETCQNANTGARHVTTCRWTGPAGWIEVRLVHDASLRGPADMGFNPPAAQHAKVHGHAALRAAAGTTFGQVMWIERPGLGVWVGVTPTLGTQLMHVADGVQVD